MRKLFWKFEMAATLLLVLASMGCQATDVALGKPYRAFIPPKDGARIVVFRPTDEFAGSGLVPQVLVNGKEIGRIEPMGYLDAVVSPGDCTVALKLIYVEDGYQHEVRALKVLNPSPGSSIFLKYTWSMGLFEPNIGLEEVQPEVATPLVAKTRRSVEPS